MPHKILYSTKKASKSLKVLQNSYFAGKKKRLSNWKIGFRESNSNQLYRIADVSVTRIILAKTVFTLSPQVITKRGQF